MVQAWRPCARGLPLGTLAAAAGLAAAPTLLVLARHGRDRGGALVAATLVCGAVLAFTVEDPAEETLSASPTSLARRRLLRLSTLATGVVVIGVVLVTLAVAAPAGVGLSDLGRRGAELAATSGLAAAAAGVAHRRGVPGAAPGGAMAGLLGVLLVSSLAQRLDYLPGIVDSPHHLRWWVAAVAGWGLAAWTWRDPGRR
jgi:hypothetical protein